MTAHCQELPMMKSTISAPASHAAETIFKNFEVRERGQIEATPNNVGIVIDVCTQIYRVAPAMTSFVRMLPWANAEILADQMKNLQDAVRSLQSLREGMPKYGETPVEDGVTGAAPSLLTGGHYSTSAPAAHAARTLWGQFYFIRKVALDSTERNLAIIVDVCTEVFRIERVVDRLVRASRSSAGKTFPSQLADVRDAIRAVELVRNRTPQYAPTGPSVIVADRPKVELQLTRQQLKDAQEFAQRVAAARTVTEQQQILQSV